MSVFDEPKIDCHCHLFDPLRFPYLPDTPYKPSGQEIATAVQAHHLFGAYGVRNALLVQPSSGYYTDNSCMLEAIAASDGAFKGIAVVPREITSQALAGLKAAGVIGIAFNLPFDGAAFYADTGSLIAKVAELGMFLQLQVHQDQILAILPLLENSPVRLLIDHCGRPTPSAGLAQPAFQAILALGRSGRAVVKLSGYDKFSQQGYPFGDTWPFVEALVAAFRLDACVWASDWPFLRSKQRVDYGPLLRLVERLFPDPKDRRKLLFDTPRALFGFR